MKELLLKRHGEELADVEAYHKMAMEHPEWEQIFNDMAEDERSHADMLKHIIDHM